MTFEYGDVAFDTSKPLSIDFIDTIDGHPGIGGDVEVIEIHSWGVMVKWKTGVSGDPPVYTQHYTAIPWHNIKSVRQYWVV